MLAALGTALFAGDLYEDAATNLCQASDLNPADPEPYTFMGRIEMAAPKPLACIEPRLARFVQQQPETQPQTTSTPWLSGNGSSPPRQGQSWQQVESLLTKAVTVNPKCADAYLQLGILSYSRHDPERAIGFYTKAIAVDPQLGEAHYRLGVAYDRTGAAGKAQQEFQLHDEIEKQQAAAIERRRREIKQFRVLESPPPPGE